MVKLSFGVRSQPVQVNLQNPLIAKLSRGADLSAEDVKLLEEVMAHRRPAPAGVDLISEGDNPEHVRLVLEGWAFRYKTLPNGRRQIIAFLLPGDFCDLHVAILKRMDHSIGVLAPASVVEIPRATIEELTTHPRIARALWWATLVEEGIVREWLVNMGQRPADRAMAHLFCELLVRLRVIGLERDGAYDFPLTQQDLGDALGLSAVHVNRTLQQLRAEGLISLKDGVLTVLDEKRLTKSASFNPNYLHLERLPG